MLFASAPRRNGHIQGANEEEQHCEGWTEHEHGDHKACASQGSRNAVGDRRGCLGEQE